MNDIIFRVIVPDNKILFKTLMLKGERGDDGVSIVSFEKTQTIGLTDYYTITLNDGTTYEFTVQNGTNAYFDNELSLLSENAVQNKIITAAINSINAAITTLSQYDAALSGSSENAVQNKVVKSAIDSINSAIALLGQYDSALSGSSENAVQNKVVKAALDLKANLTALDNYYTKTEIDNTFNNLGASGVSYNNASSGLLATDAQAAIDEVTSKINNLDASEIPYNNTSSGLSATDTQEAIDELAQGFNPTSLSDLTDTNIQNATAGQILAYASDGQGGVEVVNTDLNEGITFTAANGYTVLSSAFNKIGKTCCIYLRVTGQIALTYKTIGSFDKHPIVDTRAPLINAVDGSHAGFAILKTDGTLQYFGTQNYNDASDVNMVFVTS